MSILTESVRDQRKKVAEFETALSLATAEIPTGMAIVVSTEPLAFLKNALAKTVADPDQQTTILKTAELALAAAQVELDSLQLKLDNVQAIALASSEKLPPLRAKVYQSFEKLLSDMKALATATEKANNDFRPLQKSDASPKFQMPNAGFYGESQLTQVLNGLISYRFVESQRDLSK